MSTGLTARARDRRGEAKEVGHSYGGHWPRALSILLAAADERVQFRIFLRQTLLSSFQGDLAFLLAVVMRRDLALRIWAIGNELPPGGRRRNHGGKRCADDYR